VVQTYAMASQELPLWAGSHLEKVDSRRSRVSFAIDRNKAERTGPPLSRQILSAERLITLDASRAQAMPAGA